MPLMPPMSHEAVQATKPLLEPNERISEVLFGLIMVLTFTGSLSIADAGNDDVHAMLIGALGCNLAWGIIDGIFYLMGGRADKNRGLATFRAVRAAGDPAHAQRLIAQALTPAVADNLTADDLEAIRRRLASFPAPPARARLTLTDLRGAVAVF